MMKRFTIGEDIAPVVPQEFFELLQFNHVAALELNVFCRVKFGMEKLYNSFILYRIAIIDLKQGFHEEITNLYQCVIKRSEYVEYIVAGFVLSSEEPVPLEKNLIDIVRKVGDIENILLLIDDHMLLPLNGKAFSFLNKRA